MDRALNGGRKDVDNRSILERLKLQNFIDTPCRYLSAGQKRRVALAKLMFGHASLWLLDEPLTAIDQSGVDDLTMVISDFVGGGGMVVMTSHQSISLQGRELRTVVLGQ
jgi:heme exporter protein A